MLAPKSLKSRLVWPLGKLQENLESVSWVSWLVIFFTYPRYVQKGPLIKMIVHCTLLRINSMAIGTSCLAMFQSDRHVTPQLASRWIYKVNEVYHVYLYSQAINNIPTFSTKPAMNASKTPSSTELVTISQLSGIITELATFFYKFRSQRVWRYACILIISAEC